MNQFMNHLLTRTNKKKNDTNIMPLFTPEMIPEALQVPQHMLTDANPRSTASSFENTLPLEQNQTQGQELSNKSLQTSSPAIPFEGKNEPEMLVARTERNVHNNVSNDFEATHESPMLPQTNLEQQTRVQELSGKPLQTSIPAIPYETKNELETLRASDEKGTDREVSKNIEAKTKQSILPKPNVSIKGEYQERSISSNEQDSENATSIPEKILRNTKVEVANHIRPFMPNHLEEAEIKPIIPLGEKIAPSTKYQSAKTKEMKNGSADENLEPTVTISIGRIEVRAIMPEKTPEKEVRPSLSLDDYLRQRREGTP